MRKGSDGIALHVEVGDPLEARGFGISIRIRTGFQTLDHRDGVPAVLRVDVGNVVHPTEVLADFLLDTCEETGMILRSQR